MFVTCWTGYGVDRDNVGDQKDLRRHLICLDRDSGNVLWDRSIEPVLPEDPYSGNFTQHGYASHTPVSDGQRVYVFFGKTGVLAFDLDGKKLWQTSVGTGSGPHGWGSASSPILYKNLVIVTASAESESLVALDKETGKEVWRRKDAGFSGTWGTPILVECGKGRTDLVIAVPYKIWGFNPDDGKLRWQCDGLSSDSICTSAIAHDDVVYALETGPRGGGTMAVRAGGEGDVTKTNVLWRGKERSRIGTPVVENGRIYWFGNHVANCIDAATGKQVYQAALGGASRPPLGRRTRAAHPGQDKRGPDKRPGQPAPDNRGREARDEDREADSAAGAAACVRRTILRPSWPTGRYTSSPGLARRSSTPQGRSSSCSGRTALPRMAATSAARRPSATASCSSVRASISTASQIRREGRRLCYNGQSSVRNGDAGSPSWL